ncbi:hypothetical protein BVRB_2g033580 [Beta vulgaris subsp. vulgaris]|nr:hypothetical protein BVRB_2g033580 [Beta vulgaris subsp. vulgaris]
MMAWTLVVAAISTMKVNWGAFASMEDSCLTGGGSSRANLHICYQRELCTFSITCVVTVGAATSRISHGIFAGQCNMEHNYRWQSS